MTLTFCFLLLCLQRPHRVPAVTPFVQDAETLAAENADLRRQLAALEAVALELIAERERAISALAELQQLSLLAEPAG